LPAPAAQTVFALDDHPTHSTHAQIVEHVDWTTTLRPHAGTINASHFVRESNAAQHPVERWLFKPLTG
jgi:hypothetical protein